VWSTLLLTSALDWGGWLTLRPGRFTPRNDPEPIAQDTGWAPEPVWINAENFDSTGIDPRTVRNVATRHTTVVSESSIQFTRHRLERAKNSCDSKN